MLAPKTTCRITASSRASTAACDELLNETLFTSLAQARVTTALWRADYNTARPHSQIAWQTPDEFARTFTPRRSLALRNANGSAQEPATSTAQQGKTTAGNELKTGQNAGATSEAVYPMAYESFADVAADLPRFIDQVYNERRLHGARLSEPAAVRGSTHPADWQNSNLTTVHPQGRTPTSGFIWPPLRHSGAVERGIHRISSILTGNPLPPTHHYNATYLLHPGCKSSTKRESNNAHSNFNRYRSWGQPTLICLLRQRP